MIDDADVMFLHMRDEEKSESLNSTCDHIMGLWHNPVHQSDLKRAPWLLTGEIKWTRAKYCQECGVKLAPIFKALESSE